MGFFPRPQAEKKEKNFFDLEACQLSVGHETSLERVWHFSPQQKKPVYLIFTLVPCNLWSHKSSGQFKEGYPRQETNPGAGMEIWWVTYLTTLTWSLDFSFEILGSDIWSHFIPPIHDWVPHQRLC